MIVCHYNNMVFTALPRGKSDAYPDSNNWTIQFIDFFEGTDKAFIAKYKPFYPRYKFQIYKHLKKSLNRSVKLEINQYVKDLNDPKLKQKIREFSLNNLLQNDVK